MAGSTNGLSSHGSPRRLLSRGFNKPQTLKLGPPRRSDLQHLRHRALTKRRPFRTRSNDPPLEAPGEGKCPQPALKASRKPIKLPRLAREGTPARPFNSDPATSTRS